MPHHDESQSTSADTHRSPMSADRRRFSQLTGLLWIWVVLVFGSMILVAFLDRPVSGIILGLVTAGILALYVILRRTHRRSDDSFWASFWKRHEDAETLLDPALRKRN